MAEAAPEDGVEGYLQSVAARRAAVEVKAWNERHSDPKYVTDLWLVVTDRHGTKTRVPACRAVLIMNCLFLHSFQAGDDVEIPETICTDAHGRLPCGLTSAIH